VNLRARLSSLFGLQALIWLTMFTGLAALLCVAAAAWLVMAPRIGAPLAALLTGLGLLAVAVLLGWVVKKASDGKPAAEPETPLEQGLAPLIGERAADWTRRNPGLVVIGALATGVLIAASPGTRRFLTRTAGPVLTRQALDAYRDLSGRE
jgi:hypothetical protein